MLARLDILFQSGDILLALPGIEFEPLGILFPQPDILFLPGIVQEGTLYQPVDTESVSADIQ